MPKPASTREFRDTVFAFENEPVDERPSEFGTSQWAPVSGLCTTVASAPMRRRPEPRFGAKTLLFTVITIAVASAGGLYWVAQFLKR